MKVHIKWYVVISSSLRLLMKVWIWYRCQDGIENYYLHDGEQSGFYKKVHIKNTKQEEECSCNLYIPRNEWVSIYLTKAALKRMFNYIFNMEKVDLRFSYIHIIFAIIRIIGEL